MGIQVGGDAAAQIFLRTQILLCPFAALEKGYFGNSRTVWALNECRGASELGVDSARETLKQWLPEQNATCKGG